MMLKLDADKILKVILIECTFGLMDTVGLDAWNWDVKVQHEISFFEVEIRYSKLNAVVEIINAEYKYFCEIYSRVYDQGSGKIEIASDIKL